MPQTLLISSLSTDFQQACLPNNRDRNDKLKDTFEAKFNSPDSKLHWITVELIDKSIRNTKLGKAAGFDGIEAEHLRYAHPKICVMLSLLFNVMIIHGVVPSTFGLGITVTLLNPFPGAGKQAAHYMYVADRATGRSIPTILVFKIKYLC